MMFRGISRISFEYQLVNKPNTDCEASVSYAARLIDLADIGGTHPSQLIRF